MNKNLNVSNSNVSTFYVSIILNITQGFGNFVLTKILQTCIPKLIEEKLKKHGKVINFSYSWDSGILTLDLYLNYTIEINTYKLIKSLQNKWVAKLLKYTYYDKSIVANHFIKSMKTEFQNELKGNGLVVVMKKININY